jgi:hypothetical protein
MSGAKGPICSRSASMRAGSKRAERFQRYQAKTANKINARARVALRIFENLMTTG